MPAVDVGSSVWCSGAVRISIGLECSDLQTAEALVLAAPVVWL